MAFPVVFTYLEGGQQSPRVETFLQKAWGSGWPRPRYVADDDLPFLIILPLALGLQVYPATLGFCVATEQTWGLVHA